MILTSSLSVAGELIKGGKRVLNDPAASKKASPNPVDQFNDAEYKKKHLVEEMQNCP